MLADRAPIATTIAVSALALAANVASLVATRHTCSEAIAAVPVVEDVETVQPVTPPTSIVVAGCATDGTAPLAHYRIAVDVWPDGNDGWMHVDVVTDPHGCYACDFDVGRPIHGGRVDVVMRAPIPSRVVTAIEPGVPIRADLVLGRRTGIPDGMNVFGPP